MHGTDQVEPKEWVLQTPRYTGSFREFEAYIRTGKRERIVIWVSTDIIPYSTLTEAIKAVRIVKESKEHFMYKEYFEEYRLYNIRTKEVIPIAAL